MTDKLKSKNKVVKSNALIESRSNLSLVEQKMVLSVVSMIQPDDEEFHPYIFKIKDFMKLAGLLKDHSAYERLREISMGLIEKGIEIVDKEENTVLQTTWFSSVLYQNNEGIIKIKISSELKPYLLELKQKFTMYQLENVMKLKSLYSIRIYELLKQYEPIGTRIISIDTLKEILKISGKRYKLYADFKRYVLLSAQKELIEKTDLKFEFEEIKDGRKVVKIKFIILENKGYTPTFKLPKAINAPGKSINIERIPEPILEILPDKYHINSIFKTILKYVDLGFDNKYIISNIIYTSNNSTNNFPAYLSQALENDYAGTERELLEKQRRANEERKKRELAEKKRREEEYKALVKEVESLPEDRYKSFETSALSILNRFGKKSSKKDPEEIKAMIIELYRQSKK